MLKLNFKFVMVLFTLALFAVSCEKETELEEIEPTKTTDDIEQKILNFKTTVKNGDKSNTKILVEDAVWLTEALVNYQYCKLTQEQINTSINGMQVDSFFIEAEVTNGKVSLSDAIEAYNLIETTITNAYKVFDKPVKFYDIVDVEFENNAFKIIYAFSYANDVAKGKGDLFNSPIVDDWYWGYDLGKCDGTSVGVDATDILYPRININQSYYPSYWTDVRIDGAFFDDTRLSNSNMIYSEAVQTSGDYTCITAAEMNVYVSTTGQALNIIKTNPVSSITARYKMKSWQLRWWGGQNHGGQTMNGHHVTVFFGEPRVVSPGQ